MISGFVEQTASDYLSAHLVSWGRSDWDWLNAVRPWFAPRPWQLELTPEIVARLPLLGGGNFAKPKNPLIVNSVRLSVPELDLYTWRDRSMKAKTPHVEAYRRSGRNSLRGQIIPEESPLNEMPVPTPAQSSRTEGRSRRYRQRSGRSYRRDREDRRRRHRYYSLSSDYSSDF